MVNVNLADVPSFCTYSTRVIPWDSVKWQDDLRMKLGDAVVIKMTNKVDPGFHESFKASTIEEAHSTLYKWKMWKGATKPNKNTARKEGRTAANRDYEVTILSQEEPKIEYKFNEGELINEFKTYIDGTYGQHYAKDKFQATEFIIDGGHGTGFCIGNVLKYAQRYGKKGSSADARKDLMKVLHYALIQLYVHDEQL